MARQNEDPDAVLASAIDYLAGRHVERPYVIPPSDELKERMKRVREQPAPTSEELKTQFRACERMRREWEQQHPEEPTLAMRLAEIGVSP